MQMIMSAHPMMKIEVFSQSRCISDGLTEGDVEKIHLLFVRIIQVGETKCNNDMDLDACNAPHLPCLVQR